MEFYITIEGDKYNLSNYCDIEEFLENNPTIDLDEDTWHIDDVVGPSDNLELNIIYYTLKILTLEQLLDFYYDFIECNYIEDVIIGCRYLDAVGIIVSPGDNIVGIVSEGYNDFAGINLSIDELFDNIPHTLIPYIDISAYLEDTYDISKGYTDTYYFYK